MTFLTDYAGRSIPSVRWDSPARFLRIHRSTIVNLSRVQSLRRRGPRALELVLAPHTVLAVGPSHVESVLETLQAQRFRVSART